MVLNDRDALAVLHYVVNGLQTQQVLFTVVPPYIQTLQLRGFFCNILVGQLNLMEMLQRVQEFSSTIEFYI